MDGGVRHVPGVFGSRQADVTVWSTSSAAAAVHEPASAWAWASREGTTHESWLDGKDGRREVYVLTAAAGSAAAASPAS